MGNRVKDRVKKKSIKVAKSSNMGSARKLSRMGKKQKKDHAGLNATFLSRSSVLKRLQITLKDFRRLCILKGIYPRQPSKAPSGKKGQTFYHIKDVTFLSHEPLLEKFREFKGYMKKVRKASGRGDVEEAKRLNENTEKYSVSHLVRERYPRFVDALSDLDDCLSLVHLFATLPAGKIPTSIIQKCKHLVNGWSAAVCLSGGVSKTFVSVKGIYYETVIQGVTIRWLQPHNYTQKMDDDVDLRVMITFLDFYNVMLDFVVFKLFQEKGGRWPIERKEGEGLESMIREKSGVADLIENKGAAKTVTVKKGKSRVIPDAIVGDVGDEDEDITRELANAMDEEIEDSPIGGDVEVQRSDLFRGLTVFVSRECPLPILEMLALGKGARVGWEGKGSPISADDDTITHYVCDRPKLEAKTMSYPKNREYVQPQWLLDSSNFNFLLPVSKYAVGAPLPPHLSPWEEEGGYVPKYRKEIECMKKGEEWVDSDDEMDSEEEEEQEGGKLAAAADEDDSDSVESEDEEKKEPAPKKSQAEQDHDLAKIMMSKKAARLYSRMQHGINKKADAVELLESKRKTIAKEKRKIKIVYSDDEEEKLKRKTAHGQPTVRHGDPKTKVNKRNECIGGKGKDDKGNTPAKQKVIRKKQERKKIEKEFKKPVGMVSKKPKKKKGKKGGDGE